MNRLVVNPDRPDTWEIQLKNGTNRLGRGDAADFKISDVSVSGSHCQIVVSDGSVSIQDLGSTNGTFINGEQFRETKLQNGQTIRLGGVEMIFYADAPQSPAPIMAPPPPPQLRVSGIHAPEQTSPITTDIPPPLIPSLDIQTASSVY